MQSENERIEELEGRLRQVSNKITRGG